MFNTNGELSPEGAVEDLAWHDPPDFPDAKVHIGVAGVIEALQVWADAWDEWQVELTDYVDAGDRVLILENSEGGGKDSGAWVDQPLCLVYLLRDGLVLEVRAFFDEAQALRAAGLSE